MEIKRVLKPDGVAVFVIGDVATSSRSYDLAEQVWADVGRDSGLHLSDVIRDSLLSHTKVSRITPSPHLQPNRRPHCPGDDSAESRRD